MLQAAIPEQHRKLAEQLLKEHGVPEYPDNGIAAKICNYLGHLLPPEFIRGYQPRLRWTSRVHCMGLLPEIGVAGRVFSKRGDGRVRKTEEALVA
jgi:hypothetical protein